MKKEKLLVIVGPTAVGKTALSVTLAERFSGEIISGDSLQVYKKLDIGTAKVTAEEKRGVPHYLIDVKEATDEYSAFEFKQSAEKAISEISKRNCRCSAKYRRQESRNRNDSRSFAKRNQVRNR